MPRWPQWTSSQVQFTPPPDLTLIDKGQVIGELRNVGTFHQSDLNEVRQNGDINTPPLGADGFVPPSLLSIFAFQKTFLHNGAADSLDAVLENVQHRSAGGSGVDLLSDPVLRQRLVKFLQSIDANTPPSFPVP